MHQFGFALICCCGFMILSLGFLYPLVRTTATIIYVIVGPLFVCSVIIYVKVMLTLCALGA